MSNQIRQMPCSSPSRAANLKRTIPAVRPALGLAAALAALACLAVSGAPSQAAGQAPEQATAAVRLLASPRLLDQVPGHTLRSDRIVVKFREGTAIRLRGGELAAQDPAVDLAGLRSVLDAVPGLSVRRSFGRSEAALDLSRIQGELRTGLPLPDLNLYYRLELAPSADPLSRARALVKALRALDVVESAWIEPTAEPAVIHDPRAGTRAEGKDPQLPTPDFTSLQGYLYSPPAGINAQAVWGFPGGRGADVRIIDIEGAWLWSHEDLPAPFFEGGGQINDQGWRNHGTAVLGEIVGTLNGEGVTGIAADMQAGAVSIASMGVAAAIDMAAANLDPGDLFLIELHTPGPNSNGSGQYGYVPMEFYQDVFDVILTATANGRICIEAAGNGEQNLDDAVYQGLFDRDLRYSGAIMVGAGTPDEVEGEWFTNYGSRVDLNGWGSYVVTCGYGDLQGGPESQWYTAYFSGTSSASPIVTGAVGSLQGMCKAEWGFPLTASLALQILSDTGTPWTGSKRIGNRPDLSAARTLLLQGVGGIEGTVVDSRNGEPVSGAEVTLLENGYSTRTNENGEFVFSVLSDAYTVQITSFFHQDLVLAADVGPGETEVLEAELLPKPWGALTGTVVDASGIPVIQTRITVLDTPIPSRLSGIDGGYLMDGIPEGGAYLALFGPAPGRGAVALEFSVTEDQTTILNAVLPSAETFETGDGGLSGDSPWEWGIPTSGPISAYSGTKLWATNLDGPYGDNQSAFLTLPSQDFSQETSVYLSFNHWRDIESGYDGGNVQVLDDDAWTVIEPLGGYSANYLPALDGQPGYDGISAGWEAAVFDLTPYLGPDVQVRLRFASDGGVVGDGWYIEDLAFSTGAVPASAPLPSAGRLVPLDERPNPFHGSVTIGFRMAEAGAARLEVFDPSGRRVTTLLDTQAGAGRHEVAWDGQMADGRDAPSGIYFVRLDLDGRTEAIRRIVRIR